MWFNNNNEKAKKAEFIIMNHIASENHTKETKSEESVTKGNITSKGGATQACPSCKGVTVDVTSPYVTTPTLPVRVNLCA